MKYDLELRSIALEVETIHQKHAGFLRSIADLPSPWGGANQVVAPDPGSELVATLKASALFGKGVRGDIVYQRRMAFTDEAQNDDWINLTFNPKTVEYKKLVYEIFIKYVSAFGAYYADINDNEFIFMDFDEEQRIKFDARHKIYRLSPVTFITNQLCVRAFGLSASQVVARLKDKVEMAREELGGAFIVLTSEVLPTEEMDAICWRAKEVLLNAKG